MDLVTFLPNNYCTTCNSKDTIICKTNRGKEIPYKTFETNQSMLNSKAMSLDSAYCTNCGQEYELLWWNTNLNIPMPALPDNLKFGDFLHKYKQ